MMGIVNDLNLKKQARELGISVWQTPGFLFLMMGLIAGVAMLATYFISNNYESPEILILVECGVATVILIIGSSVVSIVEQIVKINKIKSEFVSVASHQLRTPLSAIRWETELLLSKFKDGLNEKQLRNIENINELSSRMARLVSDLLDVARIDQRRLFLKRVPVDLVMVTQEVLDEMMPEIKAHHIELILNMKKNIPKVLADRERLKMVVENLLGNSIKYSTAKGKIEIRIAKKDRYAHFSVKDNGVGIPQEQHGRVFEKFFRSDNIVKYQTEGTGLGLYIAKNIIEQMGGEIWFESVENLGSIFNFTIPLKKTKKENKKSKDG